MVSVLLGSPEYHEQMERARLAWWHGLTAEERAAHLAWEEAETAKWLAWAEEAR
jgi:hypothetical protein